MFHKRLLVSIFLLTTILHSSRMDAQELSDRSIVRQINEADGYFIYDQDYEKAAVIYEELLELFPQNHNLAYKLGVCYININGKKGKSPELLKFAAGNSVENSEYSTAGDAAPLDALYYLAYSEQLNENPAEAIEYYKQYQSLLQVQDADEIRFVDRQIKACRRALTIPENSYNVTRELLLPRFFYQANSVSPAVSGNDSVMMFTITGEGSNSIMVSYRESAGWSEPEDITASIGRFPDMFSNSLTHDGNTAIISINNDLRSNLYITFRENGKWQRAVKLPKTINTSYRESHGSISADGNVIYFSSNRPGGYGSLDIYRSIKSGDGSFGEAENLGSVINTPYEEDAPFFQQQSQTLWFSSNGHDGYGGYDIYQSAIDGNRWSAPAHLYYPLNTPSDDINFIPYPDSRRGIVSLLPSDTSPYRNLFILTREEKLPASGVLLKGRVITVDNLPLDPMLTKITLRQSDDLTGYQLQSDRNGIYSDTLSGGRWELTITHPGYINDTIIIAIDDNFTEEMISVESRLVPEEVASGKFLSVNTITFEVNSDELSREAMIELEKIITVLKDNPGLKVDLKGYADPTESDRDNRLSERRALSVAEYLVSAGISRSEVTASGEGSFEFVTNNKNEDGSDNLEGRRYNRRVSISILSDGQVIPAESYTHIPAHLRNSNDNTWYVLLEDSESALMPSYFLSKGGEKMSFVKEIREPGGFIYVMGEFLTRTDALNFLVTARESGFPGSKIISRFELPENGEMVSREPVRLFTIQIHALRNPVPQPMPGLGNFKIIRGKDGYYRYIKGEFSSYSEAAAALNEIRRNGEPQAFIKELTILEMQTVNSSGK